MFATELKTRFQRWSQNRRTYLALSSLDAHQLADLDIAPGDIRRIAKSSVQR